MLKLKQILCSILVLGSLLSSPSLWAQKETKVNIAARQISLKNLIQAVEKQTDYTFVFDNSIPLSRIVSLKGGSQYLSDVLKQAFDKSDIAYEIVGKQIVLQKVQTKTNRTISGVVKDAMGPVIGASVVEKGNPANGTITDMDGNFSLTVKPGATLVISYIGYKTQEVQAVAGKVVNVMLEDDTEMLDEVVVVGFWYAEESEPDRLGGHCYSERAGISSGIVGHSGFARAGAGIEDYDQLRSFWTRI